MEHNCNKATLIVWCLYGGFLLNETIPSKMQREAHETPNGKQKPQMPGKAETWNILASCLFSFRAGGNEQALAEETDPPHR